MSIELCALLHLTDPTLPIGGFNHSAGLETFVQHGIVHDCASLEHYLHTQLSQNWVHNDGAYVSLAYDAAQANDLATLCQWDAHIAATKTPREIRESAIKLGIRLIKIFMRHHISPVLHEFQAAIHAKRAHGFYPIAFGIIAALEHFDKHAALTAFYYNSAASTITNGVKLIPLSQMDGQDILFRARHAINEAAQRSLNPDPEWIGAANIANDIRAMQHERLYSRLYMS